MIISDILDGAADKARVSIYHMDSQESIKRLWSTGKKVALLKTRKKIDELAADEF